MTIRVALVSLFTIGALALSACVAPRVLVDGYNLREENWERDRSAILARASFEMQCPAEQLSITVIGTMHDAYATQVGVEGCGQRMVYVDPLKTYQWVANSQSAAPAQ